MRRAVIAVAVGVGAVALTTALVVLPLGSSTADAGPAPEPGLTTIAVGTALAPDTTAQDGGSGDGPETPVVGEVRLMHLPGLEDAQVGDVIVPESLAEATLGPDGSFVLDFVPSAELQAERAEFSGYYDFDLAVQTADGWYDTTTITRIWADGTWEVPYSEDDEAPLSVDLVLQPPA